MKISDFVKTLVNKSTESSNFIIAYSLAGPFSIYYLTSRNSLDDLFWGGLLLHSVWEILLYSIIFITERQKRFSFMVLLSVCVIITILTEKLWISRISYGELFYVLNLGVDVFGMSVIFTSFLSKKSEFPLVFLLLAISCHHVGFIFPIFNGRLVEEWQINSLVVNWSILTFFAPFGNLFILLYFYFVNKYKLSDDPSHYWQRSRVKIFFFAFIISFCMTVYSIVNIKNKGFKIVYLIDPEKTFFIWISLYMSGLGFIIGLCTLIFK